MHTTHRFWALFVLFVTLLATTNTLADTTAIDVQQSMIAPGISRHTANVDVEFRISIPEYESVAPIIFSKNMEMDYTLSRRSISFKGDNIPAFMKELTNVPAGLKPVTVAIRGIDGNVARVTWNENHDVEVNGLALKVGIYKKRRVEVNESMRGLVEFTLNDIQMKSIDINEENQSITLAFSSTLPRTDNDIFNEFLAGKQIKGEVTVQLVNPFE